MPIHREIGKRPVRIELCGERFPSSLEVSEIFFRPPVREAARGIELTPLIIEAVTDLMADNRPHGAVIVRRARIRIEIRRLEYGGGKIQAVLKRKIDCV